MEDGYVKYILKKKTDCDYSTKRKTRKTLISIPRWFNRRTFIVKKDNIKTEKEIFLAYDEGICERLDSEM